VLREYLPPNLSVGDGEVYDAYGDESGQIDIVIANGDQPFTFRPGDSGEYVIEGVSAVGEVKSNLTPRELTNCIDKGTKYKRLRPTFGLRDRVTNYSDFPKDSNFIPPFFVLAFDSRMRMQTVIDKLDAAALVTVPAKRLDLRVIQSRNRLSLYDNDGQPVASGDVDAMECFVAQQILPRRPGPQPTVKAPADWASMIDDYPVSLAAAGQRGLDRSGVDLVKGRPTSCP
jgi:hypothetical protein